MAPILPARFDDHAAIDCDGRAVGPLLPAGQREFRFRSPPLPHAMILSTGRVPCRDHRLRDRLRPIAKKSICGRAARGVQIMHRNLSEFEGRNHGAVCTRRPYASACAHREDDQGLGQSMAPPISSISNAPASIALRPASPRDAARMRVSAGRRRVARTGDLRSAAMARERRPDRRQRHQGDIGPLSGRRIGRDTETKIEQRSRRDADQAARGSAGRRWSSRQESYAGDESAWHEGKVCRSAISCRGRGQGV